jgi:hypothetical protein
MLNGLFTRDAGKGCRTFRIQVGFLRLKKFYESRVGSLNHRCSTGSSGCGAGLYVYRLVSPLDPIEGVVYSGLYDRCRSCGADSGDSSGTYRVEHDPVPVRYFISTAESGGTSNTNNQQEEDSEYFVHKFLLWLKRNSEPKFAI